MRAVLRMGKTGCRTTNGTLTVLTLYRCSIPEVKTLVSSQPTSIPHVLKTLVVSRNHTSYPRRKADSRFVVGIAATVPALGPDEHYVNSGPNQCDCNTVLYSLISACAVCQGRTLLKSVVIRIINLLCVSNYVYAQLDRLEDELYGGVRITVSAPASNISPVLILMPQQIP